MKKSVLIKYYYSNNAENNIFSNIHEFTFDNLNALSSVYLIAISFAYFNKISSIYLIALFISLFK